MVPEEGAAKVKVIVDVVPLAIDNDSASAELTPLTVQVAPSIVPDDIVTVLEPVF